MFAIKFSPNLENLTAIDAELCKLLPTTDSPQRIKALRTALRENVSDLRREGNAIYSEEVVVDREAFQRFQQNLDANCTECSFFQALSIASIRDINELYPQLTIWGWGEDAVGANREKPHTKNDAINNNKLIHDTSTHPFLLSLAFFQKVSVARSVRNHARSDWIKEIAENYSFTLPDGESLGPTYIPHGVFIAAAIHFGLQFQTHKNEEGQYQRYVTFNIHRSSLISLSQELNPDAISAHYR
ncbi:hypothetical protein [Rhizobium sp. AU243]|uniref:hypothetical protein n=1 Tax=Rhizobium sp. AU243 TaxID=2303425 RepID=UPI0010CB350E|nr:hypothetical protein [Rhizobium sp. AU243]